MDKWVLYYNSLQPSSNFFSDWISMIPRTKIYYDGGLHNMQKFNQYFQFF